VKTILLVEDVPLNRDLMVQLLEDKFHILQAEDGFQAIAIALQSNPDMIMMDLSLPGLDGWKTIKTLKTNPSTKHIPIIALTAHAMSGDKERVMGLGCVDYISKPVDERLLFKALQSILQEDAT